MQLPFLQHQFAFVLQPGAGLGVNFDNYNRGPISDAPNNVTGARSALTQWSGGTYGSYFTNDSTDREEIAQHPYCATGKAWKLTQVHPSPGPGSPFSPFTAFENSYGNEASFKAALNEKRVITTLKFASEQPGNGNGNYTSINIIMARITAMTGQVSMSILLRPAVLKFRRHYSEGQFFLVTFTQKFAYETCHTPISAALM